MGQTILVGKKFKLDIYYVENQSIYLDFKIIFMTILYILKNYERIKFKRKIIGKKFNGKN